MPFHHPTFPLIYPFYLTESYFLKLISIKVKLIYNFVLASGVQ